MAISRENLENWFTYYSDPGKTANYIAIREAALAFALVVIENTPASADQTAAIRHLREAVMTANAAIACDGK